MPGFFTNEQRTSYDAGTTAARDRIYQLSNQGIRGYQGYGGPGQEAMRQLAGNLGLNIGQYQQMAMNPAQFSGATMDQYMNPYLQGVIDPTREEFGRAMQSGLTQLGGQQGAARGRGSRQFLAQGQLMSDLARKQAMDIGGMRYGAFNDARGQFNMDQQNRQAMLGNLISGGTNAYGQLEGQFKEGRDWDMNQAMRYGAAVAPGMKYADQIQSQTSSPFSQILGAGLGIGSMFLGGGVAGMAAGGLKSAMGGLSSGKKGWNSQPDKPDYGWGGWGQGV